MQLLDEKKLGKGTHIPSFNQLSFLLKKEIDEIRI
jgi:hypothetical protein